MKEKIAGALHWRYATKIFDVSRPVAKEDLDAIIEAGRMAPTAYGLQPFKIVHVKNKELREQLRAASYGQAQVTDAAELLVIAARTDINDAYIENYIEHIAQVRGMDKAALDGFKNAMIGDIPARSQEERLKWAGRQAYIALGTMLETAALLEIDACPMEGFDSSQVDSLLGLPEENLVSLGYMAIGYRGEGDACATLAKVRFDKETLVLER